VTGSEVIVHGTVEDDITWANAVAPSRMLPAVYRNDPGALMLARGYAQALAIPEINAITGIDVVDGKPSLSANLMAALARRAGHKVRIKGDDTSCTVEIIRKDDQDYTYTTVWTIEMARNAGLANKNNWKHYPRAMLRSRGISEGVRTACPEVLYGMYYTADELGSERHETERSDEALSDGPGPLTREMLHGTDERQERSKQPERSPTPQAPGEDIVDAEIVEDPPDGPQTRLQLRQLASELKRTGWSGDQTFALGMISGMVQRTVTSTKSLTANETDLVLAELRKIVVPVPTSGPGTNDQTEEAQR